MRNCVAPVRYPRHIQDISRAAADSAMSWQHNAYGTVRMVVDVSCRNYLCVWELLGVVVLASADMTRAEEKCPHREAQSRHRHANETK